MALMAFMRTAQASASSKPLARRVLILWLSSVASAIALLIISILGLFYLSRAVLSDEHAVVMLGVLIQQAAVQKLTDYLWSDAALTEIGENPFVIRIPGRQGKRLLLADGFWLRSGCVSGFPMEGQ